jgi:hypothetical protein
LGELLEVDGNIRLGDGGERDIIGPTNQSLRILANPNASTEGIKFSTDGGTTTEMFIQDGGNVGIGTGTPSTKLEVVGETKSTNYRFSGPSDGGAVPAYSNSSYATVKYNEAQRATELVSSSDNAIGMAFPAFRVNESAGEQWKLWVQYKASASSSAGFYARIYEYSAELPDGKIAVSNSASNPVVQEDTSGRTDWKSNVAISTTWVTSTYTYTPNSNAKWASIVLLNWTGMGYNSLYARVGKERFFGTSSVITGSGTVNKLPLWDGTSSLTDSIITQSSTNYVSVFGGVQVSGNHTDTGSQLNLWCDSSGHGKLAVYDMQFLTGSNSARNNTALFLKNDGNVGIGTASPSAKLHVHSTTGILHTGDNFYSWVLKYLSNQTSSSGTVNYYLIAAKTQANVRLDGVLKGTRSSGVSASSGGGTRILFNTNSVALAIGGLESWGTDNPTYGHPIFTIVELTYNSVAYYALRISPSSSWVASFNHTQFEGIANNVLFTNVGAGDVSNILGFSGSESVFSYQHGNLGIGTGSPSAKLEIDLAAQGDYLIAGGDNASNGRALKFTSSTSTAGSNGAKHTLNALSSNGEIAFATNSIQKVIINKDGNVGIGITNPSTYKLEVSGAIYSSQYYATNTASSYQKLSVYGSGGTYGIGMVAGITYGALNDWAMTFRFNSESDRGFWWGDTSHSTAQGAMSLTTNGYLTVARRVKVGGGEADTSGPSYLLHVEGSPGAASIPVAWIHNSGNVADYDGTVISTVNDGADAEVLHVRTNNTTYNNGTSLMLVRGDGHVGIGTNSPNDKLEIYGNMRVRGSDGFGANTTASYNPSYVAYPGGGKAGSSSGTQAGYIKITLPQSWTNTMMQFSVDVFEYSDNKTKTFKIAGYNYSPSSKLAPSKRNGISR